jgi:hypothetical protein
MGPSLRRPGSTNCSMQSLSKADQKFDQPMLAL